jgi:hypothetical protein
MSKDIERFFGALNLSCNSEFDQIEAKMTSSFPPVECPLIHRFTPGMYIRQIFMPKGALVTSKIHKTEHPFVISLGEVSVWSENDGLLRLRAPYSGITTPGTRRLLYIWEDCIWTTFHATHLTSVPDIEEDILEPYVNPLMEDEAWHSLQVE